MQQPDISFLQLRIANIGTAWFYGGPDSPLPFSTYIITALKIDEDGYVWFFINRGPQQQKIVNRRFDAQLEFYRKGYPFFMKIDGKAAIADPGENLHEIIGKGISLSQEALSGILLVKVKIENVVYKELKEQKPFRLMNHLSGWLKNILHPVQEQQWQASPAIS